jgi:hypothetical protein
MRFDSSARSAVGACRPWRASASSNPRIGGRATPRHARTEGIGGLPTHSRSYRRSIEWHHARRFELEILRTSSAASSEDSFGSARNPGEGAVRGRRRATVWTGPAPAASPRSGDAQPEARRQASLAPSPACGDIRWEALPSRVTPGTVKIDGRAGPAVGPMVKPRREVGADRVGRVFRRGLRRHGGSLAERRRSRRGHAG